MRGLFGKITLLILGAAAFLAAVPAAISWRHSVDQLRDKLHDQGVLVAEGVNYALETYSTGRDSAAIQRVVANFSIAEHVREVAITDRAARVFAHTFPARINETTETMLVAHVLRTRVPYFEVRKGGSEEILLLVRPLRGMDYFSELRSNIRGAVIVTMGTAEIYAEIAREFVLAFTVFALFSGAVLALVHFTLYRSVVLPVKRMAEATRIVAAGNLGERVKVDSRDELGELAQAFNMMTESLSQSHESLQDALMRAKEADAMKTRLLATVSHELRTPVAVVGGATDALLRGYEGGMSEKQMRLLESVRRNAIRLSALIDDLMDLSAMDLGIFRLNLKRASLPSILRECRENLRHAVADREIKIEFRIPEEFEGTVDSERLLQVLHNLTHNASKFCRSLIQVSLDCDGDQVIIRVEDDGSGLPETDIPHVFDRFFRATHPGAPKGSGLGLAVARGIVSAHGGSILAENLHGEKGGARITVILPLDGPAVNGQEKTR